jgi:hypothetical protein
VATDEITSEPGQRFNVLRIVDSYAVIQVLDYQENGAPTPKFFKYNFRGTPSDYKIVKETDVKARNYGDRQRYFRVDVAYLDACASDQTQIGGSLAAGIISLPFKYRPQKNNSDFSGVFNLGTGLGYTFSHKKSAVFTHSAILGLSISTISLDSSNTNRNQGQLASINNFSAFSCSIGYMIQYDRVQAGVFFGIDQLSKINQRQFEWQYQSRPWISVGFGFAIFSTENENRSNDPGINQESSSTE